MSRIKGSPKTGGRKKGTPNKAGFELRELARTYTDEAIQTLAHVMRMGEPSARATAADKILDRGWGKAAQPHTGEGGTGPVVCRWMTDSDPSPEEPGSA